MAGLFNRYFLLLSALAAFILIVPQFAATLSGDRWALWVLAGFSLLAVLPTPKSDTVDRRTLTTILFLFGSVLAAVGIGLGVHKIQLCAGLMLLLATLIGRKGYIAATQLISLAAILFLLVPLPVELEAALQAKLLAMEVDLAVSALRMLGYSAYANGVVIMLDATPVRLTLECSAASLILPCLMGMGAVIGIRRLSLGKALCWLFAALLGGIALNFLRLMALSLLAPIAGDMTYQLTHDMLGFLLMGTIWSVPFWATGTQYRLNSRYFLALLKGGKKPVLTGLLASSVSIGFIAAPSAADPVILPMLPLYENGWISQQVAIDTEEASLLAANRLERRRYVHPVLGEVVATLIYHRNPQRARQHASIACFQSLGWQIFGIERQTNDIGQIISFRAKSNMRRQWVQETWSEYRHSGVVRIQLVAKDKATLFEFSNSGIFEGRGRANTGEQL